MPAGYLSAGDGDYYMAKPSVGAYVRNQLIIARFINGTLLLLEYYEGDAKNIQKTLQEREKLIFDKEETINNFQVKKISGKSENRFHKVQHFLIKNRLYAVKAISISEDNQIAKAFFESIRLINQTKTIAINAPLGAATTSLPKLTEREAEMLDDSKAIPANEADRKLLILKNARPKFSFEARNGIGAARLRLKVLFSSSGKITNVEVLESPSKLLEKEAVEAAKKTIFIPAEKDGKLVSVYKIIEQSFEITSF
jgi:TonB family protein